MGHLEGNFTPVLYIGHTRFLKVNIIRVIHKLSFFMLTDIDMGVLHADECFFSISFMNRNMFNRNTSESHYTLHRHKHNIFSVTIRSMFGKYSCMSSIKIWQLPKYLFCKKTMD